MPVAPSWHMSDEAPATPAPAAPPVKSSKAVLGLVVVNLAATGFVVFKLLTTPPAEAACGQGHSQHESATGEVTGPVAALDTFVVNLDEPGTARYLKITLQLELFPHAEAALEKSKQLIRDTILSHLSGLHLKDTLGSEAKERIRGELMASVNKLIGPDKIRR